MQMTILGIESTCDETSVAIVENGVKVITNITSSSADMQSKFGGVVPEVAARQQVKVIIPLLKETLKDIDINQIDSIAVAYGPGLIGSLLIGVETAKTLALVYNKPLIRVNHLVGHFYAPWLSMDSQDITFPAIALVVSGGHTDLLLVKNHHNFVFLGGTLDDAAGEAFDKVARILGLPYPGGPEIEMLAHKFKNPKLNLKFTSSLMNQNNFNFSFSGVKTAVLNFTVKNSVYDINEIAFAFQKSVLDVLVLKTIRAAEKYKVKSILIGGGVSANQIFRSLLTYEAKRIKVNCFFPEKKYSTDNGAMIAAAAYYNRDVVDPIELQTNSSLYF